MVKTLFLQMEVAGCMTTCMHCWAQGHPYPHMKLEDVTRILDGAERFSAKSGIIFECYPMHEVTAHPQAGELLKRFARHTSFEPLATTGVPLACREDWRAVLEAARATGTTVVWFTLHGLGETHDRAVNRKGACDETLLAIRRAHEAGFRCGINAFLTKESTPLFAHMAWTLMDELAMEEISWEVAGYDPTPRARRLEAIRPELDDLLPIATTAQATSVFWKDIWGSLAQHTEAAYVQRALDGDAGVMWQAPHRSTEEQCWLVCRHDGECFSGDAGTYGPRHGNLLREPMKEVLQRAIGHAPVSTEAIRFPGFAIPDVSELARRTGAPQGQKVHFHATSMRNCWLDRTLGGQ